MSAEIKRLQAVEVLLALDYEDARRSRDMRQAKACHEEWLAVFEQLRKVELVLISEAMRLSSVNGSFD
jgi:hypothetical protein